MRRFGFGAVLAACVAGGVVGSACSLQAPAFICITDADCTVGGFCELQGVCSTFDALCTPSERRYAESAGELAGQCVPGAPTGTGPVPENGGACDRAADCEDGFCESDAWCSFPDDDCDSGRRYGKSDDLALQGQCVAPHECNSVFKDTFQDDELDEDQWILFAFEGAEASWVEVADSALQFIFPPGSASPSAVLIESEQARDLTASQVLLKVIVPPVDPLVVDLTVFNAPAAAVGRREEVYVLLDAESLTFWVGEDSVTVPVDYDEDEVIGLRIETSSASLVMGPSEDDLEDVETMDHGFDFSRARVFVSAFPSALDPIESRARAAFGSIEICSIE